MTIGLRLGNIRHQGDRPSLVVLPRAMATQQNRARTESSSQFDPDVLFTAWENGHKTLPENNDLRSSILTTFGLPPSDDYVYHATASVTLVQVQGAINHGAGSGLHSWYLSEVGKPVRQHLLDIQLPQWLDDLILRAPFFHVSYHHRLKPISQPIPLYLLQIQLPPRS